MMLVAAAPAQSPPSTPSPQALAAAHELLVAMHAADTFKSFLPTFMQAMKPAIVQNRPDVESDYDTIIPLLLERANARLDEMLERMAPIYARNFTVDELKDVTAFYRSPIGQKLVSRLPAISKESFAVGQDFGRQIAGDAQPHDRGAAQEGAHDRRSRYGALNSWLGKLEASGTLMTTKAWSSAVWQELQPSVRSAKAASARLGSRARIASSR